MDNNDVVDVRPDSGPQPVFQALEEEDKVVYNSIKNTMAADVHYESYVEDDKEDGELNAKDEMANIAKGQSSMSLTQGQEDEEKMHSGKNTDDEDYSLEYEGEEGITEEYVEEEESDFQTYAEHEPLSDHKNDTLIVHDNDGMIKKIKVCNTKEINNAQVDQLKADIKNNKPTIISQSEPNSILRQRSSTPLSREYLALQRSVNESKILTEFVTETASEKPRKLRTKDSVLLTSTAAADHSYSSVRKNNQLTPEKCAYDDGSNNVSPSQGKRQHSKRYAPLKYDDSEIESSSHLRPRSRSKSMHNSEYNLSRAHKKLKKWPSEERLHKRTNMRSENSEFAQKQMEFLQRVIHACETPRSRSRSRSRSTGRSRSCGRRTPNQVNETSAGRENVDLQRSTSSKERYTKRNKNEIVLENDDHPVSQLLQGSLVESSEQLDDESINESNSSLPGNTSSTGDILVADVNDAVETHLKSIWHPPPKPGYDSFCWKCHEINVNLCCYKCIRSFHASCVKINKFDNIWLCPECTTVENTLTNPKRSRRNELSLDLLSQLLSFALKRMRYGKGHYNFVMPYEEASVYKKFIVNPVTLSLLQTKIENKEFRCAEEFVNETKWMLHNAYILSSRNNTKTVLTAKSIFKICRQEANEIETCAECYLNANTRTDWFLDVCSQPHLLLWAKLKGFPYWPAKAMGLGQNSLVNVRFFGEHDRAFVPLKDCFLYSEQDPNTATGKRAARELADCIKEVEEHIGRIRAKIGGFKYARFKTPYEPAEEMKQLNEMMPGVEDFIKKQQGMITKPSLQFKIYKTADNNLSIVQKASTTPELPSITHDSEEKKKKSLVESGNELKKDEENIISAPKYEVISKVNSDDSNSSKLSTVILKRKSINGDVKKIADDEAVDLPLPKMTKYEEATASAEEEAKKSNTKRKLESQTIEKPKQKYTKLDLKVPIMTIKASMVKDQPSVSSTESTNKISAEASKEVSMPLQTEVENSSTISQNVVDNLVKNKQGVTIKKLSKEISNNSNAIRLNNVKDLSDNEKEKVNKQKVDDEKARENQKVNNILKGLVPFVEIKKEVVSDNEEEIEKTQDDKLDKVIESSVSTEKNKVEKSKQPATEETSQSANNTNNSSNTLTKPSQQEEKIPVLAQVKEEVLSDEEQENINTKNVSSSQTLKETIISNVEKQTVNTNNVRIVGDTTIQKLSNKNQSPYSTASSGSAGGLNINSTSCNIGQKRTALKGVPYGPLPASAFPKSLPSKSFQPAEMNLQPRAKKSFPQHSPPLEKMKHSNNQSTSPQTSTSIINQHHLDQKRLMGKNTMVTIPMDVASNRTSTSAGTIIIGSIPVPPLTAVSKSVNSSVAQNSTARNSPATVTVSGTSGSLTTATVSTQAKTLTSSTAVVTSPTNTRKSPITVISSPLITPAPPINQINLTTRSTPPPLAGLSNTSLNNTQPANGLSETHNNATSIGGTPSTQQPTDTHLLGGLVTPTLASAITDVICRGPPKLAARPSGPLQAEGHPMFPSQAGPVCKRLVENVHKLTDFFISVVEDTMGEMAQGDDASLQAKVTLLTMELERNKQAYEQEIAELKRTSDLMLCEMRKSMENEKTRLAIEIRKQCEMERLRSVEETKRKQWCANCFREANFYCCWNTSYCDYPCQQLHWSRHALTCAQTRPSVNETVNASTSTTPTQSERHHNTKSNNSISMNSSGNFTKPTITVSQKKEKSVAKSSTSHMMSSSAISTTSTTSRTSSEVLKLPSNTYLRPVSSSNLNNHTLRCNTTYSIPAQRFNNPLPITTPANLSAPQTYTLVQKGNNNWVMSSCPNNSNGVNTSTTISSTIAAPIASVLQGPGQQRSSSGSVLHNKSSKNQIRYHHL